MTRPHRRVIGDCVERDPDADRLTTSAAHRRYAPWCRENGPDHVGQRNFTDPLKDEDVGDTSSLRVDETVTRGYTAPGTRRM